MKSHSLIFSVVIVALASGCGHKAQPSAKESLPTATVHTQTVAAKERIATEEVVGTVRAKLRSVIEAKVTGKLEKMLVVPGQTVTNGELLAELDVREIEARLDQARAVRQQADADLKRFTSLWEQKILSQAEYDTAQSKFRVADAALIEAETLMGYAKVTAPFAGVVTRKLADVGDLATPGRPLLEMEDSRALRLEADVPEAVVDKIRLGDRLPVRISALEANVEGVVSEMSPAADSQSRTFLVKLDLPDVPALRAGQFGRAAVPIGVAKAIRVPAAALIQRGQLELLFVVSDRKAQLRIVKSGKKAGNEIEILSGLSAGEQVVADGAANLVDGQPVEAK